MKKKHFRQLIILLIIIFITLILNLLKLNTNFADFYCRIFGSFFTSFIGGFSNTFYFSLFEITLISLILLAIILLISLIINAFKKHFKMVLNRFLQLISYGFTIFLVYTITAGVAYHRSPLPLPMYEEKVSTALLDSAIEYYLNDYNKLADSFDKDENKASIMPYTFNRLANIMENEMKRLDEFDYFYKYTARPKGSWFSPLLSELHITGVDFPLTSEANVNNAMPSIDIPFTMAHEIAHLKGVMREDDCNTVALYICITSSDPYVRYSGYFRGFFRLLEIKEYTNHKEYVDILYKISQSIWDDNSYYAKYFEEHDLLQDISKFVNDLYLMFNGQKEGTGSYEDTSNTIPSGKDESGNEIREYLNYSPYQKILIQNYININK